MKKKRDALLEVLKKEQARLADFLTLRDIAAVALTAKRYYLLLTPVVNALRLDRAPPKAVEKTARKAKKEKQQEESSGPREQTEVTVDKVPLHKFAKSGRGAQDWTRIDELPFENEYLSRKLESKAFVFYRNRDTGELLFVSRSMVDPALNYNRGGFGEDFVTADLYEHFYEEGQAQLDFSSMEAILRRQKELLQKTTLKKEE